MLTSKENFMETKENTKKNLSPSTIRDIMLIFIPGLFLASITLAASYGLIAISIGPIFGLIPTGVALRIVIEFLQKKYLSWIDPQRSLFGESLRKITMFHMHKNMILILLTFGFYVIKPETAIAKFINLFFITDIINTVVNVITYRNLSQFLSPEQRFFLAQMVIYGILGLSLLLPIPYPMPNPLANFALFCAIEPGSFLCSKIIKLGTDLYSKIIKPSSFNNDVFPAPTHNRENIRNDQQFTLNSSSNELKKNGIQSTLSEGNPANSNSPSKLTNK